MDDLYDIPLEKLKDKTLDIKQEVKAFFSKLRKKKPKNLDSIVHSLHTEAFGNIDCLNCANCCKSISPTLYDKDIERLSRHLKMKPSQVLEQYLYVDEEGDYVFKETPCPFLMPDNYCMVYENRPKACREYPHTDRKRFYQILNLSLKNMEICPAVFAVINKLYSQKEKF